MPDRGDRVAHREVTGERVGHTELRGDPGAGERRAEHPQRATRDVAGHRVDLRERMRRRKLAALEREELGELRVDLAIAVPERGRSDRIGTRRATEAEVDPARRESLERA